MGVIGSRNTGGPSLGSILGGGFGGNQGAAPLPFQPVRTAPYQAPTLPQAPAPNNAPNLAPYGPMPQGTAGNLGNLLGGINSAFGGGQGSPGMPQAPPRMGLPTSPAPYNTPSSGASGPFDMGYNPATANARSAYIQQMQQRAAQQPPVPNMSQYSQAMNPSNQYDMGASPQRQAALQSFMQAMQGGGNSTNAFIQVLRKMFGGQ